MLLSEIYKINPAEILLENEISSLDVFEDIIVKISFEKTKNMENNENKAIEIIKQYAIKYKVPFDFQFYKL